MKTGECCGKLKGSNPAVRVGCREVTQAAIKRYAAVVCLLSYRWESFYFILPASMKEIE